MLLQMINNILYPQQNAKFLKIFTLRAHLRNKFKDVITYLTKYGLKKTSFAIFNL